MSANNNGADVAKLCFENIKADSLAVCGDITENATIDEYDSFFELLKENHFMKNAFIIPGKMDETETLEGKQKFLDAYSKHLGKTQTSTFFFQEEENCIIIGLRPEQDDDDEPLSENQLALLDEYIRKAAERKVPAFVLCHYILNETIEVDWKYAFLGAQSKRIKDTFEKYHGKVIFFLAIRIEDSLKNAEEA